MRRTIDLRATPSPELQRGAPWEQGVFLWKDRVVQKVAHADQTRQCRSPRRSDLGVPEREEADWSHKVMPTLLRITWAKDRPGHPNLWTCSACRAAFGETPARGHEPSQVEIDEINRQFEVHCNQVHPAIHPIGGIGQQPRVLAPQIG